MLKSPPIRVGFLILAHVSASSAKKASYLHELAHKPLLKRCSFSISYPGLPLVNGLF
jgi:hypothetical protein